MVSLLFRGGWRASKNPAILLCRSRSYNTIRKISKPLRILFCGSDDFSVASLQALHAVSQYDPALIRSIDVMCRPPKLVGRGMKTLQQVPLYHTAEELGLQIHQRDTFSGWNLPTPDGENINLIIAVSFGLFVPPRIIRAAEYGGLNVHPSMLPNHRGSAPLQRMIMYGTKRTGITLQTLDDKKFDHGMILAQRPIRIPSPNTITCPELLEYMTPQAAEVLVAGIKDRVYVPPLIDVGKGTYESRLSPDQLIHAPKISKEDRHINWLRDDAVTRITRRHRALGPMYSMLHVDRDNIRRFVFHDFEVVDRPAVIAEMAVKWKTGRWFVNNGKKSRGEDVFKYRQDSDHGSGLPSLTTANGERVSEKEEQELFAAWQASGGYAKSQIDERAFASFLAFREKKLAQGDTDLLPKQQVYHMVDDASSGDKVPIFYVEDGEAIVVAIKGAGLRVKEITVEGDKRKPASAAMKLYRKRGMWRLQFRQMPDGTDRWFAEYNNSYSSDRERKKHYDWLESLSQNRREEEEERELWYQIREDKRRENDLKRKKRERASANWKEELNVIKEQNRLKRRAVENMEREREKIKEDLKRDDWSPLLLERHKDFFPEAAVEARQERLREKEKHRQMLKESESVEGDKGSEGGEEGKKTKNRPC
ncbi:Formyltransferase [Acephala macrosclerotiorum]|nr:Formyltransferase [Acephala macrosclerotiorum]